MQVVVKEAAAIAVAIAVAKAVTKALAKAVAKALAKAAAQRIPTHRGNIDQEAGEEGGG